MRHSMRMMLTVTLCNVLATLHAVGYGLVFEKGGQAGLLIPRHHVLGFAVFGLLFATSIAAPWMLALLRPVERALVALESGVKPSDEALTVARRAALRLPVGITRASTWVWLICAASFEPYAWFTGLPMLDAAALHAMLVLSVVGGVSGSLLYYVVEWEVRTRMIPTLFPEGVLSEAGVPEVPIATKFLVMLASTVLLPVTVLSMAAFSNALTPAVVVYLGVSFFAFAMLQSFFIVRSVNGPVQALAFEVQKVSRDDLGAKAPVVSNDAIGQLGEGFNRMVASLRRAAFVKESFGRYVAPEVVEEILRGRVELGGELRTATVLFSDIRDFTTLSEAMPPAEVVQMLNGYLEEMVTVVVEHGGRVDKFIGDAVMATFGVPVARGDDAQRAVRAALAMLERLASWNAARAAKGLPPLRIGIGLHTGEVVAGNIGSARKMEYTVIGDTVNTASRIEGLTKTYGAPLLVSQATHALVADEVEGREIGPVEVKGRRERVVVFEITGRRSVAASTGS